MQNDPNLAMQPTEDGSETNKGIKQKREEFLKNTRRDLRRDLINSKRYANPQIEGPKCEFSLSHLDNMPNKDFLIKKIVEWNSMPPRSEQLMQFFTCIDSSDVLEQHYGIIGLRRILSQKTNLPIQEVLDHSILTKIINMAQNDVQPHLQMEATWCLANLASGTTEQTNSLIQKGVIPIFVELSKSSSYQIAEQAIWGLGNISGDCVEFRSLVLKSHAVDVLTDVFDRTNNIKMKEQIIWVFSNICRLRPDNESFSGYMKRMVAKLIEVFSETNDPEVQDDCLFGFCKCAKTSCIEPFANERFLHKLALLYNSYFSNVEMNKHRISATSSVIGGLTSSTNYHTMMVVNSGFLRMLCIVLSFKEESLVKEACWVLSNIAIGEDDQVRAVLSEPGLFDKVMSLVHSSNDEISKEAIWILCNMCLSKNYDNIKYLIEQGDLLQIFKETLNLNADSRKITLVFEAIIQLISFFDSYRDERNVNPFVATLIEKGIAEKIEEMQYHKSDVIYAKALNILEQHFDLSDS
jgi:importin subunit alpha-1